MWCIKNALMAAACVALLCRLSEAKATEKSNDQMSQLDLGITDGLVDTICEYFCDDEEEETGGCCAYNGTGPHDITCLRSWWVDAGCSLDGASSPDSNQDNVAWWNARTVKEVQYDMGLYEQYAEQGNSNYYLKCHGSVNPDLCEFSHDSATHTMACLIKWWATDVGCSLDGTHSPIYKPDLYWWQQRTAAEVKADMLLFKKYADADYLDYEVKCYGY